MATFEIEDKFMRDIDLLIKKTGRYKTRSEFFKESVRSKFDELNETEWKKKFREETKKLSDLAYSRGFDGKPLTKEELDKIAREFVKREGIKLI
jgi:Arc/MetJ-type ribon-helix-helix transcriptional regulator